MLAVILILFPLLASAFVLPLKGKAARAVALVFSFIELGLTAVAWYTFKNNPGDKNLMFNLTWIDSLGIHFAVAMDGIAMLLVLLTNLLLPLIILSSFKNDYEKPNVFYALMLIMQMALVGVFMANDGFLFYVFWELALIPIYFICLLWGGEQRQKITFRFFIYTLFGSLFMLVALVFLYNHTGLETGIKSWAIKDIYEAGKSLSLTQQTYVFWAMFLAFGIKMPVFPFHTWQPDTYVNAPTQGTMLLSGIMLKMGTFGLIKWLLPVVPLAVDKWSHLAMLLAVIGIVYASCIAIVQKDYKRLIAYSSIAHVGLIAAGILAFNHQGLQGALIQMFSHGVNVVALFLIADIIFRNTGTRTLNELGGLRNHNPRFAVLFLIVLLGSVALPLTNGFVGEFLLMTGVFKYNAVIAAFAGLSIILGAVYMLRSYQAIMLGEEKPSFLSFNTVKGSDLIVLLVCCTLILVLGIYPKPLNDLVEPTVKAILLYSGK